MAVIIGSARHDENGKYSGGKAGDQADEVSRQEWYKHSKGWVCIRAKDAAVREKIAQNMEYACDNPHIGYDQGQNYTLFDVAGTVGYDCSKVTKDCETDCARLVRVCVWYAGIRCMDFYTGDEVSALQATGQFDILRDAKYTTTSDNLLRGDILVTSSKGHTVVTLTNGANIAPPSKKDTLRKGSKGPLVQELQQDLNLFDYRDANGNKLVVDSSYGSKTQAAVKALQKDQHLEVDGVCGPITWGTIEMMISKIYRGKVLTALNLRTGPSKDYPVKTVLKEGKEYLVTRGTDWVYLPLPDGWVNAKYIK